MVDERMGYKSRRTDRGCECGCGSAGKLDQRRSMRYLLIQAECWAKTDDDIERWRLQNGIVASREGHDRLKRVLEAGPEACSLQLGSKPGGQGESGASLEADESRGEAE